MGDKRTHEDMEVGDKDLEELPQPANSDACMRAYYDMLKKHDEYIKAYEKWTQIRSSMFWINTPKCIKKEWNLKKRRYWSGLIFKFNPAGLIRSYGQPALRVRYKRFNNSILK